MNSATSGPNPRSSDPIHGSEPLQPDSTRPVLTVRDLRKAFGGVKAVQRLSLDVHAGAMLSLIGPNAPGKSNSFNCIHVLFKPHAR